MDPIVGAALLALGGTLFTGIMGWIQAHSNGKAMRTNDGKRPGEYLELISQNLIEVKEEQAEVRKELNETKVAVATHDAQDAVFQARVKTHLGLD